MFNLGLTAADVRRIAWTAVFAFLSVFGTLIAGAGQFHSYSEAKAAALALIPAALAAAFSAVKNALLADSSKLK